MLDMHQPTQGETMQMINRIADRLLSTVAPKITAQATCTPTTYYEECGTIGRGTVVWKQCKISTGCVTTCGPCDVIM
jgi:hypothetical protein